MVIGVTIERTRRPAGGAVRPQVRVFRLQRNIGLATVFAACGVFLLAGTLSAGGAGRSAILVALAAGCAFLAVRAANSGVTFADQGVVVRDVLFTRRLPWHEVAGVAAPTDDFTHKTLSILTIDDRRIRLFALNGIGWWDAASPAYHLICSRVGDLIDERKTGGIG